MKTRRVRVPDLREGPLRLLGSEAHHLVRVLRMHEGDRVVGFDGAGHEADGRVAQVEDGVLEVVFSEVRSASNEPPLSLDVAIALLKGDKLAQVVRQATELGATRIRPFFASRCDVPRLSPAKATRLRRVAEEAAKQSGRARVPSVEDVERFEQMAWSGPAWLAEPMAERGWSGMDVTTALEAGQATMITGPEGGFEPAELASAAERGAVLVGMGPRVLRAETAPIALLAGFLSRVEE